MDNTKEITPDEQDELTEERVSLFNAVIESLMLALFAGILTIGAWEEAMRAEIRNLYTALAAIGAGGIEYMTPDNWERITALIQDQYQYLHGFSEYISANRETISPEYILNRALMYGRSASFARYLMQAPISIIEKLPFIPRDGSTECLTACRCYWLLEESNITENTKTVTAVWNLRPAEHCDTCVDRNGYTVVMQVPANTKVPRIIGSIF